MDAMDFAYAMFTARLGPTSAGGMVNGIGFEIPPHNDIFKASTLVCEEITKMAREFCERKGGRMDSNVVISIDGSWEHRRKVQQCIVPG
jgi:outer membrane receptor for Fe3+-dicitrate